MIYSVFGLHFSNWGNTISDDRLSKANEGKLSLNSIGNRVFVFAMQAKHAVNGL